MSKLPQAREETLKDGAEGAETEIVDRREIEGAQVRQVQENVSQGVHDSEAELPLKRAKKTESIPPDDASQVQQNSIDLPFDVWLMIAEQLEPLDLLHLTRVNKSLRRLFRSKSDSAQVWKLAFKNVDFPTLKATDWDLIHLTSLLHEVAPCIGCGLSSGVLVQDLACRMYRHSACAEKIFAETSEFVDEFESLHSATLSCVPGLRVTAGKKPKEYPVRSLVKPMNDYLLYLDSTMSASRDRHVRKSARDARDAFITEKQKNVEVRFEDERLLRDWIWDRHRYQQQQEAEKRKAEEAKRKARLAERFSEISVRLGALGYPKNLIERLRYNAPVCNKDKALDDYEWVQILPTLRQVLSQLKAQQEAEEHAKLLRLQRDKVTEAWRQQYRASTTSLDREAFPSRDIFVQLPSVKPFNNQLVTGDFDHAWNAALQSILAETVEARRSKKALVVRSLASALDQVGHPLPRSTTNALKLSITTNRRVLLGNARARDSSTNSEEELDRILSRFTSRAFWCCAGQGLHKVGSFWDIEMHRHAHRYGHPSGITVGVQWMRILFAILKATRLEDGPRDGLSAKLEALGNVFRCKWANCPRKTSQLMKFSELLAHVCLREHARSLNPYYSQFGPTTPFDIYYVPQAPPPPPLRTPSITASVPKENSKAPA